MNADIMSIFSGSFKTAADTSSNRARTAAATIDISQKRWVQENPKASFKPGVMPDDFLSPLPTLLTESWTSSALVKSSCDDVPMVVIPGMPPSQYPKFAKDLVAFTLATLGATRPEIMADLASPGLTHVVTVCTAVRAGTWAALGRVPAVAATCSPHALRWSNRKQRIILAAAVVGDGTALWRLCLARCKAGLVGATAITQVLVGLAPMLFVLGGAHVLGSGEVYASHYVEKELRNTAAHRLPPAAQDSLCLRSSATWDMMISAGLCGFPAALAASFARDPPFILSAQMRACRSKSERAGLAARLQSLNETGSHSRAASVADEDTSNSDEDPYAPLAAVRLAVDDDTVSVADTEDMSDVGFELEIDDRPHGMRSPGVRGAPIPPREISPAETPRPTMSQRMSPQQAEQIRAAVAGAHAIGPRAASEAADADPDETVRW